jgi:hypothetical protein
MNYREILLKIADLSNLDNCQSAEDMQYALEEINDLVKFTSEFHPIAEIRQDDIINTACSIGELKTFINKHNLPDDGNILIQRVEDFYYDMNHWGVVLKEGEAYNYAKTINAQLENGDFENKEEWPKHPGFEHMSEENLKSLMEQYHPAWCPVKYNEDNKNLYIDLHY